MGHRPQESFFPFTNHIYLDERQHYQPSLEDHSLFTDNNHGNHNYWFEVLQQRWAPREQLLVRVFVLNLINVLQRTFSWANDCTPNINDRSISRTAIGKKPCAHNICISKRQWDNTLFLLICHHTKHCLSVKRR